MHVPAINHLRHQQSPTPNSARHHHHHHRSHSHTKKAFELRNRPRYRNKTSWAVQSWQTPIDDHSDRVPLTPLRPHSAITTLAAHPRFLTGTPVKVAEKQPRGTSRFLPAPCQESREKEISRRESSIDRPRDRRHHPSVRETATRDRSSRTGHTRSVTGPLCKASIDRPVRTGSPALPMAAPSPRFLHLFS